ncbi:glycoside hydrolase family 127 protein [Algoriphagus halophytocola]|uniref:Glycoside hydrolase family 127 protein n=1 Tax=Algoriphagus halophytocola TaxID=2991499 RepID=A0ABY6MDF2_9BACT|nr:MULTISPECIES: glycoside hydrolase family 127 protein [unclassified Algoriphagus]UZD21409.1 glycoside hydrolase family 127 protein [Algoriphagus sp. TR-M5]WBL42622.1 glycoside hydrolase family 127 protein [Algoriphagus sp. TR-M9]
MVKNLFKSCFLLSLTYGLISCNPGTTTDQSVNLLDRIPTENTNQFYISNRAPLAPSALIKLPVGSVKPEGFLKEYLIRQKNGLTGNLGEISAWLQKENNAWLSKDGTGEWGWEEVPYWLKGYANIGYIMEDQAMIDESMIWLEAVLTSQRENGDFGPKLMDGDYPDFWAKMIMLYCLQSYYEHSQDERVITLMTNYFKYELTVPDEEFLEGYWQRLRGGDNLHSVLWLYNRTGDEFLLELAEKIHQNTADWSGRDLPIEQVKNYYEVRDGGEVPDWYRDQVDWHNVNHAQAFREPAQYYLLSKDEKDLQATYENFEIIREHFGQVPGGMFGSDENARPGYADPRQGVETCGMVEQMNSDEHLLRITGDPFWADHAEEVAFNTYPAAVMPDFKALHYITSPNMALLDAEDHSPGIANSGPFLMMNPFSSRCCQHNHAQGWPYFIENLWMATPDNGVVAAMYGASKVTVKVGDGTEVNIEETTHYPFEEEIKFSLSTEKPVEFPLYLRIPAWAKGASISINGEVVKENISGIGFAQISRTWANGDQVSLTLPMQIQTKIWEKNSNSLSVSRGPLTYSLKIREKYFKKDSEETAQWDSKWQKGADTKKWPSWEIHPVTDWNYSLVVDENDPASSFEVMKGHWPKSDFPFSLEEVPIKMVTKARQIPEWQLDEHGLVGELKDLPKTSDQPVVDVTLVPMGAARLRITAFPHLENSPKTNE